ncbi:hypothetical protein ABPG72_011969 [Tetrahymena utriculariae]
MNASVEFYFVKSKFEKKSELFHEYKFQINDGLKNYLLVLKAALEEEQITIKKVQQQSYAHYGCKCSITKQDIYFQQGMFKSKDQLKIFLEDLIQKKNLYHAKGVDSIVKIRIFGEQEFDEQGCLVKNNQSFNSQDCKNILDIDYTSQQYKIQNIISQQNDLQNPTRQQSETQKENQLILSNNKVQNRQKNLFDTDQEDNDLPESTPYHHSDSEDDINNTQSQNNFNEGFYKSDSTISKSMISFEQENQTKLNEKLAYLESIIKVKDQKIDNLDKINKNLNLQIQKLERELQKCKCNQK